MDNEGRRGNARQRPLVTRDGDRSLAILPIYLYGHPVLRKKARPVREVDGNLITLAEDMIETMHSSNGIGLAATQVGSMQRLIVVDIAGVSEDTKEFNPIAMVNPVVVEEEGLLTMEEGCLSIPDIREEVERAEKIRVRYTDIDSGEKELTADGILGRVILHEIDHLNGVLFIDRLSAVRRKLLKGRLNKIRRGEVDINYPVIAETVPSI